MNTIFTVKRDEYYVLTAYVLEPNAVNPSLWKGPETIEGFEKWVCEQYPEAQIMPPSPFFKEAEARKVHTPEITQLLKEQSELLDMDLNSCFVYGSPDRPLSNAWVRIENAVCIPADRSKTGFYSYLACSQLLNKGTVDRFGLEYVSRPSERAYGDE